MCGWVGLALVGDGPRNGRSRAGECAQAHDLPTSSSLHLGGKILVQRRLSHPIVEANPCDGGHPALVDLQSFDDSGIFINGKQFL